MSLLYKRPNSPYFYVTKTRQSTGTINRKDAEEFARKALKDLWRREELGEKAHTWSDLAADWLDTKSHKKTIDRDADLIDKVTVFLSKRLRLEPPMIKLADVDGDLIREYGKQVKLRTTASTANRHLAILRAMLKLAEEYEWIAKAPKVKAYPSEVSGTPRWLTTEEFALITDLLPPYSADLAVILVQTGLRFANGKGLKWSWITPDGTVAHIPATETKTGRMYTIPLSAKARDVLARLRLSAEGEYVFEQHSYDHYRYEWDKSVKAAAVAPATLHDLRHTFASWHTMQGTPDRVLMHLGGWANTAMLQVYAHLSTKHLTDYADNLNVQK